MTSANGLPTIKTFSGLTFNFLEPTPAMISMRDIAHALSNVCRFGGQAHNFYSVAQHSVLVSLMVGDDRYTERIALLHDAAEAYIGDMVKPLKRCIPRFQEIEERIMAVILERFDLKSSDVIDSIVKTADREALTYEGKAHMEGRDDEYGRVDEWNEHSHQFYEYAKRAMGPKPAEIEFYSRAAHLFGEEAFRVQNGI